MTSTQILETIRGIMIDVFDIDADQGSVTPDRTANDIDEWDSLSHILLMVAVERKFNVKFSNSEIEALKRVGDLVALVQAKAG